MNDQSLTDDFLGDPDTTVQTNSTTGDPLFEYDIGEETPLSLYPLSLYSDQYPTYEELH